MIRPDNPIPDTTWGLGFGSIVLVSVVVALLLILIWNAGGPRNG